VRAAGIEQFGGDVRPLSLPDPRPPGVGETLIEVRAAAVAPWDDFVRAGSWDVGVSPPMALGVAASGTVGAMGIGVDRWSLGDEVLTHPVPLLEQVAGVSCCSPAPTYWPQSRRTSHGRPPRPFRCPRSRPIRPSLRRAGTRPEGGCLFMAPAA
jgi:NADPH:quinone reductase-like Zn-dependent oxidoreductase